MLKQKVLTWNLTFINIKFNIFIEEPNYMFKIGEISLKLDPTENKETLLDYKHIRCQRSLSK